MVTTIGISMTAASTLARSTVMTSSSPSLSPVRLSPECTTAPSGEVVWL